MIARLPPGPFGTFIADPAWRFRNRGSRAAAENHYSTMSEQELVYLFASLAWVSAPRAHLYLWTTASHLELALRLMGIAGFTFKLPLVWVKTREAPRLQIGLGNYFRHAHELCLFGARGGGRGAAKNLPSVFFAPREQHSRKPDRLYEIAERMSPGPRLELFARRARDGWTAWGNEAPAEGQAA